MAFDVNQVGEEIHLRDYWRILRRRWRLFALVWGVVFLSGSLATFLTTPQYRGDSTVLVEEDRPTQMAMLEGFGDFGGAIAVETEMELLRSRTIAERVVTELGLDTLQLRQPHGSRAFLREYRSDRFPVEGRPIFRIDVDGDKFTISDDDREAFGQGTIGQPFTGDGTAFTLHLTGPRRKTYRIEKIPFSDAIRDLRRRMSVQEVGKKTNVIRVTVDLEDPFLARDVANKITEVYVSQNVAFKSQEASQMLEFLDKQLETIRGNLEKGEQELDQFKSEKGIFVLSETAQKLIEQMSKLELTRAELELQQRQFGALMDNLQNAGEKDGPYLLGQVSLPDPLTTQLIGELSQRLVELRTLRQDLTEDSPRVAVVRAQIDEFKSKVRLAVENAKKATDNRMETVSRIIGGYENELRTLPQAERQLAALTRKSEVNAELYTFLLKKHEEARISIAGIVGNVRVVDPSVLSDEPVAPKKKRNVALFFMAGLILGLAAAFFVEYVDDSVKTLTEVEQRLGLNVYGVIPFTTFEPERPLLLAEIDPRSPVQEAFRSLRTNLQFFDTESPIRTVLCTSALPGVGKTTTTVNLAVTLAQGGASVLLIDCDLRRPQVHRFFDVQMEPGLTNALTGDKHWSDFAKPMPKFGKLHLMTAGALPPNPVEFLASQKFGTFVDEAKAKFDFVLFDIPPVVAFTDAAVVANRMDAVFLIVELGNTSLPLTNRALELLRNVQAKVRGAIVNKVDATVHQDGYYTYSYAYYYAHDSAVHSPSRESLAKIIRKIIGS